MRHDFMAVEVCPRLRLGVGGAFTAHSQPHSLTFALLPAQAPRSCRIEGRCIAVP
jgi:hypothetical protein